MTLSDLRPVTTTTVVAPGCPSKTTAMQRRQSTWWRWCARVMCGIHFLLDPRAYKPPGSPSLTRR